MSNRLQRIRSGPNTEACGGARKLYPYAVPLALLLAWEAAGHAFGMRPDVLPTPSRIFLEIWENASEWQNHLLRTSSETLLALMTAIACAVPAGLMAAASQRFRRGAAVIVRSAIGLPLIAAVPVLVFWLGLGAPARMAAGCWFAVWPLLRGIIKGVASVPDAMSEWLSSTGAGFGARLSKVYLPAAAPFFLRSLRPAFSLALSGVLVVEFLGADSGLGYMLLAGAATMNAPVLLASLSVVGLMAAAACYIIHVSERFILRGRLRYRWGGRSHED